MDRARETPDRKSNGGNLSESGNLKVAGEEGNKNDKRSILSN